jgi:hypothetical protein
MEYRGADSVIARASEPTRVGFGNLHKLVLANVFRRVKLNHCSMGML